MSKMHRATLSFIGLCLWGFGWSDSTAPVATGVEPFDTDPRWEGVNNVPPADICRDIVQDFGWNPGGTVTGELPAIGGRVTRSFTPASFSRYVGPFTLEDRLQASGQLRVTASEGNSGVLIGWFNTKSRGWRTPNSLVIRLDGEGGAFRVFFEYGTRHWFTGGGATFEGRYQDNPGSLLPADGRTHAWQIEYDPQGAENRGEIRLTLDGTCYRAGLEPGHKEDGAEFDRFGILNVQATGNAIDIFMDQLEINGEVQSLESDPGWDSVNSRGQYDDCIVRPYHDFGWRPTARAGGAPGEIGGIVWRIEPQQIEQSLVYATPVVAVDTDVPLTVSGKIAFTAGSADSAALIGWFDDERAVGSPPRGFVGVLLEGPSRIGHYLRPIMSSLDGRNLLPDEGPIIRPDGISHAWSFRYDPVSAGQPGSLKLTLDSEEVSLAVPGSITGVPWRMDRFGVLSWGQGGHYVEFFIDDLDLNGHRN